jgi:hypothetical protein
MQGQVAARFLLATSRSLVRDLPLPLYYRAELRSLSKNLLSLDFASDIVVFVDGGLPCVRRFRTGPLR